MTRRVIGVVLVAALLGGACGLGDRDGRVVEEEPHDPIRSGFRE